MRYSQYGTGHCAPSSVSVLHTLQPTARKPLSCQSRSCTCHPLQDASLKANWSPFLLHPLNITGKTRRATSAWPILFSFSINLGSSIPPSSSSTAASTGLPPNSQSNYTASGLSSYQFSQVALWEPSHSGAELGVERPGVPKVAAWYLQVFQWPLPSGEHHFPVTTSFLYFYLQGSLKAANHTFCQPGLLRAFEGCGDAGWGRWA